MMLIYFSVHFSDYHHLGAFRILFRFHNFWHWLVALEHKLSKALGITVIEDECIVIFMIG